MTPDGFRRIALSMPGAVESSHMGHPDFRVGRKIFATLGWPDNAFAMVKLTPAEQAAFVEAAPKIFAPVAGGWGRRGSTNVRLAAVDAPTLKRAVETAWGNIAPKPRGKAPAKAPAETRAKASRKSSGKATATATVAATEASRKICPYAPIGSATDLAHAFSRARAAVRAAKLPEVEESTSFGTPSLKVRGKPLVRVKDRDTLVVRCAVEEKALLIEAAPDIYFETDHYKGWPAVLVRLSKIDDAELRHRLERAWRLQAPAKLVSRLDGSSPAIPKARRTRQVRSR
jgi:hypothetical protein